MVGFETSSSAVVMHSLSHAMSMLMPDADPTESLKGWEERATVKLKTGTMMQ